MKTRQIRRMMLRNERFATGTNRNFDPELEIGFTDSRFALDRIEAARLLAWLKDAVPWMDHIHAMNLKELAKVDAK